MVKSTLSPATTSWSKFQTYLLDTLQQSCRGIEHIQASMIYKRLHSSISHNPASLLQATAQCRLGMLAHPRSDRQKCRSTNPCRRRRTRARPWACGCRSRPPGGPGTAAAPPIRQISSHSRNCGSQTTERTIHTAFPLAKHRQAYTTSARHKNNRTMAIRTHTFSHTFCSMLQHMHPELRHPQQDAATLTLPPNQAGLPLHVTEHLGPPCNSAARSRVGISEGSGGTETPTSLIAASTRPAYRFTRSLKCELSSPGPGWRVTA